MEKREVYNMKVIGKVFEYNGYTGYILSNDGKEYLLLKHEIINDNKLQKSDEVVFVAEEYKNSLYKKDIARFIRKLDNK